MSKYLKKNVFGAIPLAFEFWADFEFAQLHQNMRQKDDPVFADMLDRIRYGNPTSQDIQQLHLRVLPILAGVDRIENAVNIFDELCKNNNGILCLIPTVSETDRFNKIMSQKKNIETIDIEAEDSNVSSRQLFKREPNYKNPRNLKAKKKTNATAGLETNLHVGVSSRVMLRRNLDTQLGLVNGAIGTITGFVKSNSKKNYIAKIKVKFDQIDDECEIERCVSDYEFQKNVYVARAQFPFTLAWAITIHKAQGLSLNSVLIDLGTGIFQGGMAYVALSRARKLANVHLIDFDPGSLFCSKRAFDEYKRLATQFPQFAFNLPELCNQLPTEFAHLARSEITSDNNKVVVSAEHSNTKQKINTIQNYPIKFLTMNDNSSYANSIVQVLVHLNDDFRSSINQSTDQQTHSFKNIYNQYYECMYKPDGTRAESGLLRNYVANFPQNSERNLYTDLSKKDAYVFLIELLQRLPIELLAYFQFEQASKRKCTCGHVTAYNYQTTIKTTINLSQNNKQNDFAHSFTRQSTMTCDGCNLEQICSIYNIYKIPDNNQFIIIYVPTFDASKKFLNSILTNYDPESIHLPIDIEIISKNRFRIFSILVRNKSNGDGHFQIWTRNLIGKGWVYIDDASSRKYVKLYNNLKNVECIILEKCKN
jgi:hypothetical protein